LNYIIIGSVIQVQKLRFLALLAPFARSLHMSQNLIPVIDLMTNHLQALPNQKTSGDLKNGSLLIVSWRSQIAVHNPEIADSSPALLPD